MENVEKKADGARRWWETLPMKRGEVWWVEFDPAVGSEIRKRRPAVKEHACAKRAGRQGNGTARDDGRNSGRDEACLASTERRRWQKNREVRAAKPGVCFR
jgi:hypothetical protein